MLKEQVEGGEWKQVGEVAAVIRQERMMAWSREVAVGMVRNGHIQTYFAVGNLLQIGHRMHEEEGG